MLRQIHPLDWAGIVKDFVDLVYDKVFDKMPYKQWREFDAVLTDYNIENVRVYWDQTGTHTITIYFDTADGRTLPPYAFDSNDNSFGSFLYENYLYGEEMRMRVKDHYTDLDGREWQTYDYISKSVSDSYDETYWKCDTVCDTLATKADTCEINRIDKQINNLRSELALATPMRNAIPVPDKTKTNSEKENFAMKFNFDFGPVNSSTVRMSLYGLAVKNKAGTWVSYDAKAGDIMDVDILNFDGAKFLYKMPVAVKDIAIGDVVIHNGIPMFVIAIATNGSYITAVDPVNGERKDIMLPKSPFGFNFATKVVNFLGNSLTGTATADNPFGNLGLMLMLSDDNKDMNDLLPLMLMTGNSSLDMSNPMMLYFLAGNRTNDPLALAMLMGGFNATATPAKTCNCGGHCGENHTQS